jgi:hypothetical protein
MKYLLHISILLLLLSCEPQAPKMTYYRYVIGMVIENKQDTKYDSLETGRALCYELIYLDRDNNCFAYKYDWKKPAEYFRGKAKPHLADSLIRIIEDLQQYRSEFNIMRSCVPLNLTTVVENDTMTDFKYIQSHKWDIGKFVKDFAQVNGLAKADSIQTVIKYRSYISEKISRFWDELVPSLPGKIQFLSTDTLPKED